MESLFDLAELQQDPHGLIEQPGLNASVLGDHSFQHFKSVFKIALAQHARNDKAPSPVREG